MDDKERDFDTVENGNESLLGDDIQLDAPSDFVDETPVAEDAPAEKTTLFSSEETEKPAEEQTEEPETAETEQEEKTESEQTEDQPVSDEDTPVLDENAPVPGAEEMNEALKPKLKESSVKKKKRIIIAVVAAVLVVAITLGIALPIYFVNKDKIFVKSAEDFANYNDGTYFVLEKDVTVNGDLTIERAYNIDLNGHSLVVNGTLKYETGTEGTISIGTIKKKEFTAKGLLQAETLEFATPNANVNLVSSVTVNTMNVEAKSFTLATSAQANGTVTVNNAETVNINGPVSFGEGEKAKFVTDNCTEVKLNANVSSAVELNKSTMTLAKNATASSVALDGVSRAAIYGKVSGTISTLVNDDPADQPEGGEGTETPAETVADEIANANVVVLLGQDFSCPEVKDIATLAIERRNGLEINVYNCATVKYIDRLAAPVDVNIDERADGSLVAVSSKVQNAQGYSFRIDGKEWVDLDTNEFDITSQLTSQTGTHRIEVFAKGNYSYDAPFELGESSTLYLSGSAITCEYTYQIQLATPSNLSITASQGDNGTVYTLSFDRVAFATRYEYYVNGVKYTFKPTDESARVSIDITDKLTAAGAYSVRVVAAADSADILTSKPAMTSTVITEKLQTPTLTATTQEDGSVVLTMSTTENVFTTYLVQYTELQQDGSKKVVTLVTTNTTVTLTGLTAGDTITVTAQANGYYTTSDAASVAVTAYAPPVNPAQ